MKLGYWDLRDLGAPARMMLAYGDIDYEDKRYSLTKENQGKEWVDEKQSLGLAFPNLPYLVDGDLKITESLAIYRYIGKKTGLTPTCDKDEYECDMVASVVVDMRQNIVKFICDDEWPEHLQELKEKHLTKLKQIDSFFASRQYTAGGKLTYVDFFLYEVVDQQRTMFPNLLDGLTDLHGFMKRFESLKPISAYFKSDRYKKFPIYGYAVGWGGKDHDDRTW